MCLTKQVANFYAKHNLLHNSVRGTHSHLYKPQIHMQKKIKKKKKEIKQSRHKRGKMKMKNSLGKIREITQIKFT